MSAVKFYDEMTDGSRKVSAARNGLPDGRKVALEASDVAEAEFEEILDGTDLGQKGGQVDDLLDVGSAVDVGCDGTCLDDHAQVGERVQRFRLPEWGPIFDKGSKNGLSD